MAKRFTETEKWRDRWFLSLTAEQKLAWLFVCDECDHAGLIEITEPIANLQIGFNVDWDEFVAVCGDRITQIGDGKYWVQAFCKFQYGELNEDNRVHKSVIRRLENKGLIRALQGPTEGAKYKDKYKDFNNKKKGAADLSDGDWVFPEGFDTPEVREALDGPDGFVAMRKRIKKPIKSKPSASRSFKSFDDAAHLVRAIDQCVANDWQGLKADYGRESKGMSRTGAKTFAQQRVENSRNAIEEFSNE